MTTTSALAGRLAARVAGSHPLAGTYVVDHLAAEMVGVTARAAAMVTEATRLDMPAAAEINVVDRTQWVERNLAAWVHRARALGATWSRIGESLGMTRQSAWERFSGEE